MKTTSQTLFILLGITGSAVFVLLLIVAFLRLHGTSRWPFRRERANVDHEEALGQGDTGSRTVDGEERPAGQSLFLKSIDDRIARGPGGGEGRVPHADEDGIVDLGRVDLQIISRHVCLLEVSQRSISVRYLSEVKTCVVCPFPTETSLEE